MYRLHLIYKEGRILDIGFWCVVHDWSGILIRDFGDVFLVRYITCMQSWRAWFVLEKELWSLEVKGVQKLRQLSGLTLSSWFSVNIESVRTKLGG